MFVAKLVWWCAIKTNLAVLLAQEWVYNRKQHGHIQEVGMLSSGEAGMPKEKTKVQNDVSNVCVQKGKRWQTPRHMLT